MSVAGIHLQATYVVVTIVSNKRSIIQKPQRIRNIEADRLVELLEAQKPLEVGVEASGMIVHPLIQPNWALEMI